MYPAISPLNEWRFLLIDGTDLEQVVIFFPCNAVDKGHVYDKLAMDIPILEYYVLHCG
jgi:hypothetical protein